MGRVLTRFFEAGSVLTRTILHVHTLNACGRMDAKVAAERPGKTYFHHGFLRVKNTPPESPSFDGKIPHRLPDPPGPSAYVSGVPGGFLGQVGVAFDAAVGLYSRLQNNTQLLCNPMPPLQGFAARFDMCSTCSYRSPMGNLCFGVIEVGMKQLRALDLQC